MPRRAKIWSAEDAAEYRKLAGITDDMTPVEQLKAAVEAVVPRQAQREGYTHSQEKKAEAVKLLREAWSVSYIAEKLGMSRASVYGLRKPIFDELPETNREREEKQNTVERGYAVHEKQTRTLTQVTATETLERTEALIAPVKAFPPVVEMEPAFSTSVENMGIDDNDRMGTATCNLELASGGTLALWAWDVNPFRLSAEDREFMYALVDMMRDYGERHPVPKKPSAAVEPTSSKA